MEINALLVLTKIKMTIVYFSTVPTDVEDVQPNFYTTHQACQAVTVPRCQNEKSSTFIGRHLLSDVVFIYFGKFLEFTKISMFRTAEDNTAQRQLGTVWTTGIEETIHKESSWTLLNTFVMHVKLEKSNLGAQKLK